MGRHVNERDTCLCIKCENMNLIFAALQKAKLFSEDLSTVIEKICCPIPTTNCYLRECSLCELKTIQLSIDNTGDDEMFEGDVINYDLWGTIDEPGHDGKVYKRTCLLYTSPSPRDRTRSRMPSSA